MSIDPDDSVLEQALRSDLPSADAKERVRRRLLAAGLAVGNGVAATTSAAATGTAAATTTGLFAKAMGASWGIKLGLAAAITIPSVGLLLDAPTKPVVAAQAPTPTPTPIEATPPSVAQSPATPVVEAAPEAPAKSVRVSAPSAVESEPTRPEVVAPSQVAFTPPAEVAAPPAKPSSTLAEETRLLDSAFAELAAGHHQRAAALVAEHEAKFPGGLLQQERNRVKVKLLEGSRGE